ncbi:MAG: hypothetical protein LAP38_08015 [Acidobacteriia bacterium]|nr:hypothetical protein [Terriglobia bacterium]
MEKQAQGHAERIERLRAAASVLSAERLAAIERQPHTHSQNHTHGQSAAEVFPMPGGSGEVLLKNGPRLEVNRRRFRDLLRALEGRR